MIKIAIIGSGNVAQHLIKIFLDLEKTNSEICVNQIFARKKEAVSHLAVHSKIINNLEFLEDADVYILAISDEAISSVSSQLPFTNRFIVHTSGSMPLEELDCRNQRGVFYPLQTFSKNRTLDFKTIPICLETEHEKNYQILDKIAKLISNTVLPIDSQQRKALHISAVFVSNFVNHLYLIGEKICSEHNISFDILKPLILETAQKITILSPSEAQTGPAKRKSTKILKEHENFIFDETEKNIYKILTQSIQKHDKEL